MKVRSVRRGEQLKALSLLIKNKKLSILVKAIVNAKKKQKLLRLLRLCFFALNATSTRGIGLRFAIGGSLNYRQFIVIAFPSTSEDLLMELATANPLACILLPLAILYSRGIEDIPDPSEKCKIIRKVSEEFHNKQVMIEMKKLNSLVEDKSTGLELPVEKVQVLCAEKKLSLFQRYKLKALTKNNKIRKRVQHFSEFIKKFPEFDASEKIVIVKKIAE